MHYIEQIAKGLPLQGDVFVDPELSNVADMYVQNDANFIARQVFPSCPVEKESGIFFSYSKADFNRDEMAERADGAQSAVGEFRQSQKTYTVKVWSLAKDVGPQTRANSPKADQNAVKYLSRKALLRDENIFVDSWWGSGKWTTQRQGHAAPTGSQVLTWMDVDADPVADIENAIEAGELVAAGMDFNRMVFSRGMWRIFKNHPNVIARINNGQTSGPAMVTTATVAALFGIERVLVSKAVQTTSAKGVAEASSTYGRILSSGIGIFHCAPAPSVDTPSAGYFFDWTGYMGAQGVGTSVFEEPVPLTKGARRYTLEHATQANQVAADLGIFMYDLDVAAA